MKDGLLESELLEVIYSYIENTASNIFLTGKAGTGKTTFLKNLQKSTEKIQITLAPTGVAAMNAKGVTINSLFQLPPLFYIPENTLGVRNPRFKSTNEVIKDLNYSQDKTSLIKRLELLIIDEVSMVRCDQLDMIDQILRNVRSINKAFGGVQLLVIGDLYQLPPVIKKEDWDLLNKSYNSPYFFSANVIRDHPLLQIELNKVFRQADDSFLEILNQIRNNTVTEHSLRTLNQRHITMPLNEHPSIITITSHNADAEKINDSRLESITNEEHVLEGTIIGTIRDIALPAERYLKIKKGAQVMLTKNDAGDDRRFYNGKIGTVQDISKEGIELVFPDGSGVLLQKSTWSSFDYKYSPEQMRLEQIETGQYVQYPIKLAWAVTIHKSQGLTFKNAIIDAGNSFAPGQVYVALSRVQSLEGLTLTSKIGTESLRSSKEIVSYIKPVSIEVLKRNLPDEQEKFLATLICDLMSFNILYNHLNNSTLSSISQASTHFNVRTASQKMLSNNETLEKFEQQLITLFKAKHYLKIPNRVNIACDYFLKRLDEDLVNPIQITFLKTPKLNKKHTEALQSIQHLIELKKQDFIFLKEVSSSKILEDQPKFVELIKKYIKTPRSIQQPVKTTKEKPEKTNRSKKATYELFIKGNSISEIARQRDMSTYTVEAHIAEYVKSGEIEAGNVIGFEKLQEILLTINDTEPEVNTVKERLGPSYSFFEIRLAINHWLYKNSDSSKTP
ncbi:MAG: AAA family ATPase [Sphingobacteriaceae bacterium]|nr:AAA family ATPase [Sphingobacteriaceae bacterium]